MDKQFSARPVLQAGQVWHLYADAGATVVTVRGTVSLRGTGMWVGGQILHPCIALREGESHTLQDAGWITVFSERGAEAVCLYDNRQPGLIVGLLRRLLASCLPRRSASIWTAGRR